MEGAPNSTPAGPICPMCGKPVSPEALTCPACGEALAPTVFLSDKEREARRQGRLQRSLAGLGALIVLLAIFSMIAPPLAVAAALLLGPASIATMIKATAVYSTGQDPSNEQLSRYFWRFLGITALVLIGVPLALGILLGIVCAVMAWQ